MASSLLKLHTLRITAPSSETLKKSQFKFISYRPHKQPIHASLSSSTPPTSRDEAITQAKTCISTTLEKPLNSNPKLTGKLKKLKQPRYRVEVPVMDDSPASLTQLALDMFSNIPIRKKGSKVNITIIWPDPILAKSAATQSYEPNSSNQVDHIDIFDITDSRILNAADVAVMFAPEKKHLAAIKSLADTTSPKPVLLFNPKWAFEDEESFGQMSAFVGSFEVIYAFMGLEVKGILSKKRGMVFKYARNGVMSGEKWSVFVEEDGEMKVVSRFSARPSIGEVENVLYNLMAINSPITKSAKFLKDLVSNVTGKKMS